MRNPAILGGLCFLLGCQPTSAFPGPARDRMEMAAGGEIALDRTIGRQKFPLGFRRQPLAGPIGIGVGLELVFAGPGVEDHAEEAADGAEEDAEEDEAGVRRDVFGGNAEGGEELSGEGALGVDNMTEKEEEDAELQDGGRDALDDVLALGALGFPGKSSLPLVKRKLVMMYFDKQ